MAFYKGRKIKRRESIEHLWKFMNASLTGFRKKTKFENRRQQASLYEWIAKMYKTSIILYLACWGFTYFVFEILKLHWLKQISGVKDHASFCFPCAVCFGWVLGHFIVTLQFHLHWHDYNEVVMRCNHSFSSLVRLSCVHKSCGEPRPTSLWQCNVN